MKTFSPEVKQSIMEAQNGFSKGTLEKIDSFHHSLPNTKANRKRYSLYLHSPMNCVRLSFNEHANHAYKYITTQAEADVYERWLVKLMVNMPFSSDEANGITYQKIGRG